MKMVGGGWGGLMLPMLATLMGQVHVELAHLATSFLILVNY